MERLEEIHKELKRLDDATKKYKNNKDNSKWAWSKYYHLDKKKFIESSNKKEKLEKAMQELEDKIVELNISIDKFTKTVEKNDLEKAKLATTQLKLITKQKELTKSREGKVSEVVFFMLSSVRKALQVLFKQKKYDLFQEKLKKYIKFFFC